MSEESSSLEERVQLLEEQNDALKRSGLLLVILVLVMGGLMIYESRTQATSIQTDGVIFSQSGKPRGAITTMGTGHLGVLFFNHQGLLPQNVQYASIPYLDGFAIYDRNGRPRIMFGMDDKDNPILAVVDADGKTLFSAVPRAASSDPASSQPSAEPPPVATPSPAPTSTP